MKKYDLIVIGSGIAGIFSAHLASKKGMSVLLLEKGKSIFKRKSMVYGWFGHNFFVSNKMDINNLRNKKKIYNFIRKVYGEKLDILETCRLPSDFGHKISKFFIENFNGVDIMFNSEVLDIDDEIIYATEKEFKADLCALAVGKHTISLPKNLNERRGLILNENSKIGILLDFTDKNKKAEFYDFYIGHWEESEIFSSFIYFLNNKKSGKSILPIMKKIDLKEIIRISQILSVVLNGKIKSEKLSDFMSNKSFFKCFEFIDYGEIEPFLYLNPTITIPFVDFSNVIKTDDKTKTNKKNLFAIGECAKSSNFIECIDDAFTFISNL